VLHFLLLEGIRACSLLLIPGNFSFILFNLFLRGLFSFISLFSFIPFGVLVSIPVPVHRFYCGVDGHLCTFPCGLDSCY